MGIVTGTDLSAFCNALGTVEELNVIFPGGAVLSAQSGYETGDAATVVKSMLGQINTAIVPLSPFFTMLDFVKAVLDCVESIPKAIVELSPAPVISALAELIPVVNKLLTMFPPLPIFILVKGILHVIVVGIGGIKAKLQAFINQSARIARAATKAAATGNHALAAVVACASSNLSAQLDGMNREFGPLNRLIGVINTLLELAGLDCIPSMGGVGEVSQAALAPLDAIVDLLTAVDDAIPAGLPSLPGVTPGACL
jgi:hypothetical protein